MTDVSFYSVDSLSKRLLYIINKVESLWLVYFINHDNEY